MKFQLILLRFCVVCITLVAVAHLQDWHMWSLAGKTNPVCNTQECKQLGEIYQQNMDINGKPCTDFYDYACHNWPTYNPRPRDLTYDQLWNVEQLVQFRTHLQLKKLLEDRNKSPTEPFGRAKLLYKLCMEKPHLPRFKPPTVKNIMKNVAVNTFWFANDASLPQLSFWEIDERYIKLTGEPMFFNYITQINPTSHNEIITELKAPRTPYGAILRSQRWPDNNQLKHYKEFLSNIIMSLADETIQYSKAQVENLVQQVLDFRQQLYKCIRLEGLYGDDTEQMSIGQFQLFYDMETNSQSNAKINWVELLRAVYKNSNDSSITKITQSSKIQFDSYYFSRLGKLLTKTLRSVVVNHIQLYFAERHLDFTPQMQAELKQSISETGVNLNSVIRTDESRWKECIERNTMDTALGKAYVSLFFPQKQKSELQGLFETTKKLLKQQISECPWLDLATKQKSTLKVKKMTGEIGYPDWYDTNKAPTSNIEDANPTEANVHYINEQNSVVASAAYFQLPIYSLNVPYVIDYGSTLEVFGHELHHAFDKDGITFNAEGGMPGWSPIMIKEHENHTKCFEEQYKKYKHDEYKRLKLHSQNDVPFEDTLDEDIADVMGLKLAYTGFKQALDKNNGVCPVLPGFEKFDCEKLFFIAFANNFCGSLPLLQQERIFYEDTHTVPQLRVNVVVANMKEFSAAFSCKPNDPLYSKRTCDFWK